MPASSPRCCCAADSSPSGSEHAVSTSTTSAQPSPTLGYERASGSRVRPMLPSCAVIEGLDSAVTAVDGHRAMDRPPLASSTAASWHRRARASDGGLTAPVRTHSASRFACPQRVAALASAATAIDDLGPLLLPSTRAAAKGLQPGGTEARPYPRVVVARQTGAIEPDRGCGDRVQVFVVTVVILLTGSPASLLWLAHRSAAETRRRGYRSSDLPTLRWLTGLINPRERQRRHDD
jgi:hypothetical protein